MEQSVAPPTRIVEDFDEVPFVPMVDKVFLSNDPISMGSNSNFNGIKILVSTNQDGGSLGAREILPMEDHNEMDEDTFKMSAEMVLSRFPPSTQEKAIQYYIENDRHGSDYTTAFNNLIGISNTPVLHNGLSIFHLKRGPKYEKHSLVIDKQQMA